MNYNQYFYQSKLSDSEIHKLNLLKRDSETALQNLQTGLKTTSAQLGLSSISELKDDELLNEISSTQREFTNIIETVTERLANPVKTYTVDLSYLQQAKDALTRLKREMDGLYEQ